jgi:hypothetical protein
MNRRWFLSSLAGMAAGGVLSRARSAQATLVVGLTLPELVTRSTHIVVLSALDAFSRYADLGGHRCIVTDTRVRVEDVLGREAPSTQELTVRTLGGKVGGVRELVLGQASLSLASVDVAFLRATTQGQHWFVGMAQGHYPLRNEGERILNRSTNLPEIRDFEQCAVRKLNGARLSLARAWVQEASQR